MATDELQLIAQLLEATLDPTQQKKAEIEIIHREKQAEFSLLLLKVVASPSFKYSIRLSAALCFKNLIRRHWTDEDGTYKLPKNEVAAVKQEIVGLMLSSPPGIQAQIGDAISIIADSDFYERWNTLVDDLVSRLTPDNLKVNNGVLQVSHSIYKRWRPLVQSNELYTEILHVLEKFGPAFLSLLQTTDQVVEQNSSNKEVLQQAFANLELLVEILYDLSCQDLPQIVEENVTHICEFLLKYLRYDNALLHTEYENESGQLESVKARIFEVLNLFMQKYEDAFGPHIGPFVESSWSFLTTIGPDAKYDLLVSRALQFLTTIAHFRGHGEIFSQEATLEQIVEKVIIPNLSLRESDLELFEDEPIEFIRRDLEGSDSETRRKAATDFLKMLLGQYQDVVTKVATKFITHYLSKYAADSKDWKSKDIAIYLFASIASLDHSSTTQGVINTNKGVNILEFFSNEIAKDLVLSNNSNLILQVDAIKYLYTFRNQLSPAQWQEAFPLLVQHLGSPNYVVYSYAAISLERALRLGDQSNSQGLNSQASIAPLAKDLLEHLFKLIEQDSDAPEKVQENEFVMRCIMRVLIVLKEGLVPLTDLVLAHLIKLTDIIQKNPSNPRFYYYHFEAVGALVRFCASSHPGKLETAFYTSFARALQDDVQEFLPYIFQIFAALLEANPSSELSEYYQSLIVPVLTPSIWEFRGNIPALVRLLAAMIPRGTEIFERNNQLEAILGIFQKLLSSKSTEAHGFDLLEVVATYFPPKSLEKYIARVLEVILLRLQNSKTETLVLKFVHFYHFISSRDTNGLGADFFDAACDMVQPGIFTQIYLTIILPETQKLTRPLDRKTACVSFTHTLASSEVFASKYRKGWGFTCEALLKLIETPPVVRKSDNSMIAEHDVDSISFGVGFTPLATCAQAETDPWPEIKNVKQWIGMYLKEADAKTGGRVAACVRERLQPEAEQMLLSYMQ